jgi:cell division ATPase FtsA
VVEGDAVVYHAVLPMGGGHITADLATDLEISMRAAEQIKREYIFIPDEFDPAGDPEVLDDEGRRLSFPRAFVQKSVEQSAGELVRMIDLAVKESAQMMGPRSQIFMTGGGLA